MSAVLLVQLERLLVALFGELEPDEQSRQDDERMTTSAASVTSTSTIRIFRIFMGLPHMAASYRPLWPLKPGLGLAAFSPLEFRSRGDERLDLFACEFRDHVPAAGLRPHQQSKHEGAVLLEEEDVAWLLLVDVSPTTRNACS